MNRLEKRLRAELPELVDALMMEEDEVVPTPEQGSASVTSVVTQPRRPSARFVALVGVVAVGALGVGLAASNLGQGSDPRIEATSPVVSEFGEWTSIAAAPIPPRAYASTAWTGSKAVFWAGSSLTRGLAYADGATYDPMTDRWESMTVPGWGHPGLTSAFFDGELYALAKGGGTRFDPVAGEWNDLPPVEGMFLAGTVATDDAVWGLGSTDWNPSGQPDLAIARYDPGTDSWVYGPVYLGPDDEGVAETIAGLGLLEATVSWSGREIVVWSGPNGGLAFDPESQSWRTIALPTSPSGQVQDSIAIATDDAFVLMVEIETSEGRATNLAVLEDDGWRWLDTLIPFTDFDSVTLGAAGNWLVAFSADQRPVAIHLPSGSWQRQENAGIDGVEAPNTVWTGKSLIVWGGATAAGNEVAAKWTPPD